MLYIMPCTSYRLGESGLGDLRGALLLRLGDSDLRLAPSGESRRECRGGIGEREEPEREEAERESESESESDDEEDRPLRFLGESSESESELDTESLRDVRMYS